jgi:ABC-type transporter Mla subunit MlaD
MPQSPKEDARSPAAFSIKSFLAGFAFCFVALMVLAVAASTTMTVHIVLDDVSGIAEGDRIYFKGVPVGSVESTRLLDAKRIELTAILERDKIQSSKGEILLYQDATIVPSKPDASGKKRVELDAGTLDGYPILDGQIIFAVPGKGSVTKPASPSGVGAWIKRKLPW